MKNLILILMIIWNANLLAQIKNTDYFEINQQKKNVKKGYSLRLKSIFDDSRCPQNTQCIWAGEVSVTLEIYKKNKLIEEKTITINSKNLLENKCWFENYFPKKMQSIQVFPYPNAVQDSTKIEQKKVVLLFKKN